MYSHFSQCIDAGRAKGIKRKIGRSVTEACQENFSAFQYGHASRGFASPRRHKADTAQNIKPAKVSYTKNTEFY